MHNLQLTEEQDLIVDTVRKFVAETVAPHALERDEHRELAQSEWLGLAELGLFGLTVPESHGGAGLGMLPLVAALESVGAHSSSLARLLVEQVQVAMAMAALETAPAALAQVLDGSCWAAFVGPEHGLLWRDGKLHGTAELVVGGLSAACLLVVASDQGQPVLLQVAASAVPREALRSLGLASAGPARLRFEGVAAELLASGAAASKAIAAARRLAWLGVAAIACGGGAESVQAAKRHAGQRIAFGKPLLVQEAVLRKLVDSQRAVDAARQLTWHAARLVDLGQEAFAEILQARLLATEAMVAAADEAIQVHGGFGYTVEYHVERHYRDGKTLAVLDGGNERLLDQLAVAQFA
jgi:alkylation response protein AidB-like acyl-CoA dehydrogenase